MILIIPIVVNYFWMNMEILGLEPLAAFLVGVGALVLAPVISAASKPVLDTSQELAKNGLVWGMDVLEKTETFFAEVGESFEDIVAEAKAEHAAKTMNKNRS